MFRRIVFNTTRSLFLPTFGLPQQKQELAVQSLLAVDSLTATTLEMVQTRRQSQAASVEAIKGTIDDGTANHAPKSNKRAIGGNGSPASVLNKRRKVLVVEESTGLPKGVVGSEAEDPIIVLPDLPAQLKGKGEMVEREALEVVTSGTLELEETKTRSDEPSRPTHTRFASEDPDPQIVAITTAPRENSVRPTVEDSEDDGSEGDAPEAVTLLSGQEQARSREEEAAKALERQEAGARKKRKERDTRLREQAALSKRNKKRKSRGSEEDGTVYTEGNGRLSTKLGLPALLPEEILLAVPAVRPPTPPLEHKEQKQPRSVGKHKIFEEKPPKDIKSGPFSIRVLESTSKSLAPRVGKVSSSVRQRWLAGRPGRSGRGGIERRKVGGGFLRR